MIGIDEVGRGCWAGPLLVVACRVSGQLPEGLTDSKVLSRRRRQELFAVLPDACEFGEGWVQATEIDELGLADAMRLGVDRALEALGTEFDEEIIMDGTVNYCAADFGAVTCVARADGSVPAVSAASVYAKVLRDQKMVELSVEYPEFGFDKHVGYGTSAHLAALRSFGVTPLHRRSYKPVQQFL